MASIWEKTSGELDGSAEGRWLELRTGVGVGDDAVSSRSAEVPAAGWRRLRGALIRSE